MSFQEANQVVHTVSEEWHYPIMIKYGFKPLTFEGVGFVRSYLYARGEEQIKISTGVNSDYWEVIKGTPRTTEKRYWADLERHLKNLGLMVP